MLNRFIEKFFISLIGLMCFCIIIELVVNISALFFLMPIYNGSSYGYISRKDQRTVVPLNKYSSRQNAQIMLPFDIIATNSNDRRLFKQFNEKTNKYGYINSKGQTAIAYEFIDAQDFINDYAIVAIDIDGRKKYGTIDTQGRWLIAPKYDYLCPFDQYYTRACIDKDHCGAMDKYGNEVTLMVYNTNNLKCKGDDCAKKICAIGKDGKEIPCNNFL